MTNHTIGRDVSAVLECHITYHITGVPDRDVPFSPGRRQAYRPDTLRLRFTATADDVMTLGPEQMEFSLASISGPRLKNDGTESKNRAVESTYTSDIPDDWPVWARELISGALDDGRQS